jgi:uncharacterized protein
MDITPQVHAALKLIQSYGNGGFRVNGIVYTHPVIVCGDKVLVWNCDTESPLTPVPEILSLSGEIDVLLIGCGNASKPMPPAQRQEFAALGFTCDVMDSAAAARTYNVLTAEGRRVAAALIPIS